MNSFKLNDFLFYDKNLIKEARASAESIYNNLLLKYRTASFVSLRDTMYESPLIPYYIVCNVDKLNVSERDKQCAFVEKAKGLLKEHLSCLASFNCEEIVTHNGKEINAEIKDEMCAIVECMLSLDDSKNMEYPDTFGNGNIMLINWIRDRVCLEEFTGLFCKYFNDELQVKKCDIFNRDKRDFIIAFDGIVDDRDYYITPEHAKNCKILFGKEFGSWFYDIENYAIQNGNTVKSNTITPANIFDENIEPFAYTYYCINQYINSLILTVHDELFDKYVLEYVDTYMLGVSLDDILSHLFFIFDDIMGIVTDSSLKKLILSLCDRTKFRGLEIEKKIYKFLKNLGVEPYIAIFKLSREMKKWVLKNSPQDIINFLGIDNDVYDLLCEDQDILQDCRNEQFLRVLLNMVERDKVNAKDMIESIWTGVNQKEIINLINRLKLENKDLTVQTVVVDRISFVDLVYKVYSFIQNNGIKNKTAKDFIKSLKAKVDAGAYMRDDCDLDETFNKLKYYFLLSGIEEKIRDAIFNLNYKDQIEEMKRDAEKQIKEFKSKFFQEKSYDFERFYKIFCERLLEYAGKERFDFDDIKDTFKDKFEEIVNNFKPKEIKDNLATAEYLYFLLKEQKMELTPIFVGVLKAVEQFMCSFVNYLIKKNKTNSREIDGVDIFAVNWKKITGIDLENFIDNHFLKYDTSVDFELKERFRKLSPIWRNEARNGNVHKDNVYSLSRVEDYVEKCYKLIATIIFTVL